MQTHDLIPPALPGEELAQTPLLPARKNVIIEYTAAFGFAAAPGGNTTFLLESNIASLKIDRSFDAVPVKSYNSGTLGLEMLGEADNFLMKANVAAEEIPAIQRMENVVKVWDDTEIAPFAC